MKAAVSADVEEETERVVEKKMEDDADILPPLKHVRF